MANGNNVDMKVVLAQLNQWCRVNNVSVQSVYDQCKGMTLQDLVYYLFGVVKESVSQLTETQDEFTELYNFVNNYFKNLDVNNELKSIINVMVESGEFSELFAPYLESLTNTINNIAQTLPGEVLPSLTEIESKYPSGKSGTVVASDEQKWYYWNGTAWTLGGDYVVNSPSENSVYPINFNDAAKTILTPLEIYNLTGSSGMITPEVYTNYRYIGYATQLINATGEQAITFTFNEPFENNQKYTALIKMNGDDSDNLQACCIGIPPNQFVVARNLSLNTLHVVEFTYEFDDPQKNFVFLPRKTVKAGTIYELSIYKGWMSDVLSQLEISEETQRILCVGDSLTYGSSTYSYPKFLQDLLGDNYTVSKYGDVGEKTEEILARCGALPIIINNLSIPSDTTTTVAINNPTNILGMPVIFRGALAGVNSVNINGITGYVTMSDGQMLFRRSTSGDAELVRTPSAIITTLSSLKNNKIILWCGANNSEYISTPEEYVEMLNYAHNYFNDVLFISVTNRQGHTFDDFEDLAFNTFGLKYLKLKEILVNYGLVYANLSPTPQDLEDIANYTIPSSLRVDATHFNEIGYSVIAKIIYERVKELNW